MSSVEATTHSVPAEWIDKRPRRGLKPWSPTESGGVMLLHISPQVKVSDQKSLKCIFLNSTGRAIWEMCDGWHSVQEMVTELAERFGVDEDVMGPDVYRLLEQLQSVGMVEIDGESFF